LDRKVEVALLVVGEPAGELLAAGNELLVNLAQALVEALLDLLRLGYHLVGAIVEGVVPPSAAGTEQLLGIEVLGGLFDLTAQSLKVVDGGFAV